MSAIIPEGYVASLETLAVLKRAEREREQKEAEEQAVSGKHCILTPAYGRDYKSKAGVYSALTADCDFILNDMNSPWDGKPVNLPQLIEAGYESVTIRYDRLCKAYVYYIRKERK